MLQLVAAFADQLIYRRHLVKTIKFVKTSKRQSIETARFQSLAACLSRRTEHGI
jgi:hypothetical protein